MTDANEHQEVIQEIERTLADAVEREQLHDEELCQRVSMDKILALFPEVKVVRVGPMRKIISPNGIWAYNPVDGLFRNSEREELNKVEFYARLCGDSSEVAARVSISQNKLARIERGLEPPTPDVVERITRAIEELAKEQCDGGQNRTYERVVGSTAFVLDQLELSYRQTREQAQGWFRFSRIAACVGLALLGIGVITVIFGQTTAGAITVISSVIPDAAAALFFAQSKAAHERVDTIQAKLTEAREVQTAVEIVNTISDPTAQDNLKAEIVRKALRLE